MGCQKSSGNEWKMNVVSVTSSRQKVENSQLKLEISKLLDQLKQASKKTQIAVWRFEGIRNEDEEKATNQEAKLQLRQEIEKRLDAEQQVFDMIEGMKYLRKEIPLVPITIVSTANGDLD
jgi:1,4-dihydroxy-2-naphthoyl-CoA synthase